MRKAKAVVVYSRQLLSVAVAVLCVPPPQNSLSR